MDKRVRKYGKTNWDEKIGISYILQGDYYYSNLALPETKHFEMGRFGREQKQYLLKYKKGLYTKLITSNKLNAHLYEIE